MNKNILLISQDQFGQGSDELGKILLKSYLATLLENNDYSHLILVNSGVKIACVGSDVIDDLKEITNKTEILICQTCLNYYELVDQVAVGNKSNMHVISQLLNEANKVVNI